MENDGLITPEQREKIITEAASSDADVDDVVRRALDALDAN